MRLAWLGLCLAVGMTAYESLARLEQGHQRQRAHALAVYRKLLERIL